MRGGPIIFRSHSGKVPVDFTESASAGAAEAEQQIQKEKVLQIQVRAGAAEAEIQKVLHCSCTPLSPQARLNL